MKSGASQKYDTMPLEDICNLPIKEIATKDAVLFLWTTVPFLHDAFHVMDAWGFKYKTMLTWRKIMSQGMGFWFSGQTEHILFGIRGKIPAFHCHKGNIIQYPTWNLGHSEKPAKFRGLINEVTKGLEPKIELFARQRIEGWDCWGNDLPLDTQTLLASNHSKAIE
jgi:N6-adenosine-specific RNA methylase IME4